IKGGNNSKQEDNMKLRNKWRRAIHGALAATVALSVMFSIPAPSAQASARGCSGRVCIYVRGSGRYVESVNVYRPGCAAAYYGQVYLYSANNRSIDRTNGRDAWGPPALTKLFRKYLPNYTLVCGEGWCRNSNGSYRLMGRACVTVHS